MAAADRLHGARGEVKMDPAGGTSFVTVASLNKWDLDMSSDKVKVTCFKDTNQIYVQGLPDIKGSYGGFYDPVDGLTIFDVITGTVAPTLQLFPSDLQPLLFFQGRAWMDGKISVDSNGAIGISGSFMAADAWTIPS
jgi:hypothetical protein